MTFRLIFLGLTLPALLNGCGYVKANELKTALCLLDEDGDGVPRGGDGCDGIPYDPAKDALTNQILDCDDDSTIITNSEGVQVVKGALRSPELLEVPYDGIDNDCSGADSVDADGDGYAGISQATWSSNFEALWNAEDLSLAKWPSTVPVVATDDSPGLDCVDYSEDGEFPASNIFPNNPSDTPYNDIDEDCANDNDFDGDGDNFASLAEAEAYASSKSYDPNVPATDCDDARSDVHPLEDGETPEDVKDVPYDEKDKRCDDVIFDEDGNAVAAVITDFDADGDGWMPAGVEDAFERYLANYPLYADVLRTKFTNPANGELKTGDCYDNVEVSKIGEAPPPSTFFPGATDTPYDGFDTDCGDFAWVDGVFTAVANDFDIDGDGYLQEDVTSETFENYVDDYRNYEWPTAGVFPFKAALDTRYGNSRAKVADYFESFTGDCKDTGSGAAAVNPIALEVLGDDEDQDCDVRHESSTLRRDTASFNFSIGAQDFSVTTPTRPFVAVADEHYIVFSKVEQFQLGPTLRNNVGLAFYLDRNDTSVSDDGALSSVLPAYGYEYWWDGGTSLNFNGEILGVAVNGSNYTVGFSYTEAARTLLAMKQYIHGEGVSYTSNADNLQVSTRSGKHEYTGGDFQFDSSLGRFIAIACDSDGAHLLVVKPEAKQLAAPQVDESSDDWPATSPTGAEQCFIQTKTYVPSGNNFYLGTVDSSGDVDAYRVIPGTSPLAVASNPWDNFSLQAPAATTNENLLILHEDSNEMTIEYNADDSVQVSIPGGSAVRLKQADAMYLDDTLYVAAVYRLGTGGTPRIAFAYGEPNSLNWISDYPIFSSDKTDLTPMVPQGVGLAVDEERVILAVTAKKDGDDYLGWAVMGPAED